MAYFQETQDLLHITPHKQVLAAGGPGSNPVSGGPFSRVSLPLSLPPFFLTQCKKLKKNKQKKKLHLLHLKCLLKTCCKQQFSPSSV